MNVNNIENRKISDDEKRWRRYYREVMTAIGLLPGFYDGGTSEKARTEKRLSPERFSTNYKTREELMKHGFKLIDIYYNDDNGRVSGCLLEKDDNIVGISIPGMVPHPSMDDIILAFDQKLFHEIGRLFPHLWMAHSYDEPTNTKAYFRYSDLYNVE